MATGEQEITAYANRWVAGQSGNPTGMRGKAAPRLLDKLKAKLCAEYKVKRKRGQPEPSSSILGDLIVAELCRLALEGEDERIRFVAIKEILDRTDGKPNQSITVTDATTDEFRTKVLLLLQEWRNAGVAPAQDEEALAVRLLSGEGDVIDTTAEDVTTK